MPVPVTRLLGQSPAGLSATGESDTRNYYDMIAARQELDLRPQLERLDRLILRSEGIDPKALTFAFRPLWQMDAVAKAALALSKAQVTQIYAGLGLWPTEVTARLVEAKLVADGTYPNAAAVFAEREPGGVENSSPTLDFNWAQPRDPDGRWTEGSGGGLVSSVLAGDPSAVAGKAQIRTAVRSPSGSAGTEKNAQAGFLSRLLNLFNPIGTAHAEAIEGEENNRNLAEEGDDPRALIRIARYVEARRSLREIDPTNRNLETLEPGGIFRPRPILRRLRAQRRRLSSRGLATSSGPMGNPSGNLAHHRKSVSCQAVLRQRSGTTIT